LLAKAEVLHRPTRRLGLEHAMVALLHCLEPRKRMATYWAMVILAAASFTTLGAHAQDQVGREGVVKVSGCMVAPCRQSRENLMVRVFGGKWEGYTLVVETVGA
jgi:hypothetical protein